MTIVMPRDVDQGVIVPHIEGRRLVAYTIGCFPESIGVRRGDDA